MDLSDDAFGYTQESIRQVKKWYTVRDTIAVAREGIEIEIVYAGDDKLEQANNVYKTFNVWRAEVINDDDNMNDAVQKLFDIVGNIGMEQEDAPARKDEESLLKSFDNTECDAGNSLPC